MHEVVVWEFVRGRRGWQESGRTDARASDVEIPARAGAGRRWGGAGASAVLLWEFVTRARHRHKARLKGAPEMAMGPGAKAFTGGRYCSAYQRRSGRHGNGTNQDGGASHALAPVAQAQQNWG